MTMCVSNARRKDIEYFHHIEIIDIWRYRCIYTVLNITVPARTHAHTHTNIEYLNKHRLYSLLKIYF